MQWADDYKRVQRLVARNDPEKLAARVAAGQGIRSIERASSDAIPSAMDNATAAVQPKLTGKLMQLILAAWCFLCA